MGNINEIEENNPYIIKIVTQNELTKININRFLHYQQISYSLTRHIFSDDGFYHRITKCCFCNKITKYKDIVCLFNGYHPHNCGVKHYHLNRYPTSHFCTDCFNNAIETVEKNRLFVYQVIMNLNLVNDIKLSIIKKFINITKYYRQLLGGILDC